MVVERDVHAERLQVNKQLSMMEVMKNELTLSEQELQIEDLKYRIE